VLVISNTVLAVARTVWRDEPLSAFVFIEHHFYGQLDIPVAVPRGGASAPPDVDKCSRLKEATALVCC
jgi:hypothetical protein